jgi:cytochrome c nitrite reductase small subunit
MKLFKRRGAKLSVVKQLLDKFKSNKWFYIAILLMIMIILYFSTGFALRVTDNAPFCGSCHVMHEHVRTHYQSVHAEISCNECHAPKQKVKKVVFKAYAGTKDIYKNLLGDIDDVIHATELTKEIINDNCADCHTATNANVILNMNAKKNCTDCHQQVPHFPKKPIDERRIAGE